MTVDEFASQLNSTVCATGAVPVPLSAITTGEMVPVFAREMLPDALPLLDGPKATVNEVDVPAGNASGKLSPEMLNPGPLVLSEDTVILALLPLLSCIVLLLALPTTTLPKATELGDAVSPPALWPVPVSATFCGLPVALSAMLNEPARDPAVVGVKVTLTLQLALFSSLAPQLLVWAKSPDTLMLIATAAVPPLLTATFWVLLVPRTTLPKASVAGVIASTAVGLTLTDEELPLLPPQLTVAETQVVTIRRGSTFARGDHPSNMADLKHDGKDNYHEGQFPFQS